MRTYLSLVVFIILLPCYDTSFADANDGELFGYSLGMKYSESTDKQRQNAPLVLITAESPIKPSAVEQVFVLASPVSHTIGKIIGETWYESGEDALVAYEQFRIILRKKYGEWEHNEITQQTFHASQFRTEKYDLNVQVSGPHRDNPLMPPNRTFQFQISLAFRASTSAAVEFENLADVEFKRSTTGTFSDDELRGL